MLRVRAVAVLVVLMAVSFAPAEVCNVKVVTDASPDYSDMDSMVRSITGKWQTPEEKCWAIYYWNHIARRQTAPIELHGMACTDPIRQFNDYGYTMCSTIAGINCSIWDAMGLRCKYWDISLHTVPEVEYNGRWHMYDNSMSALYTLCDGKTIAGVEDIGKDGACQASGGKTEPGHIAKYHCLYATSRKGFLTGADCTRDLNAEYGCFNPKGLKYRYYFYDWDRGHRYILNLRENEAYARHYKSLGKSGEYYVPLGGKDPESVNPRYRIRGNGVRTFSPVLKLDWLARNAYSMANVKAVDPAGLEPAEAGKPGEVVFKIEAANVITSLKIVAKFERKTEADINAISISTTNGLTWQQVWKNDKAGQVAVDLKLVSEVNGAYEVLVRAELLGKAAASDARLHSIEFEAITQLNSKTQPKLLLGKNTIYVDAGEQTESIVLWPDLQGDNWKPYAVEHANIVSAPKHDGWKGVMHAIKPNEDAYVVFRIDAPGDVTRVTYGGRFYNRAPKAHIDLLHSFDGGKTWTQTYSLTNTKPPWDVIHYETIDKVPAGTRSVLMKYLLNAAEAGDMACSIYAVRMEVNHRIPDATFRPMEVTFNWSEVQADRTLVERSHTELVEKLPHKYTISVAGADHPIVNWLRVNLRAAAQDVKYGYSDGKDAPAEKFLFRWMTCGKNLAEGKPYTVSVPSKDNWGAGDPNGTKLTDGVVGPPYAGGTTPSFGLAWDKGTHPLVTVDLGKPETCGAFRIQVSAGWPWWDALKGEVKDKVELLTSLDDKDYTSQGVFSFDLRWKDIPINHMMPDDETATGYNFELIPEKPLQARYVRFSITPERIMVVSEVQVLDFIKYEPFDQRIALPDEEVIPLAPAQPAAKPAQAAAERKLSSLAVTPAPAPPKVDGSLDDQTWKNAAVATDFKLAYGDAPKGRTRLLVASGDKCLYVAVECFEPPDALDHLFAKVTQHDGTPIWQDDEAEVFIDPTNQRASCYQFIVNSRGVTWDGFCDPPGKADLSWEPKYDSAVKIGKQSWTVELALPYSIFDRTERFASEWAFNASRGRVAAGEVMYWSPVFSDTSHVPANFGIISGMKSGPNPAFKGNAKPAPAEKTLFDFENADDLKAWANLDNPDAKQKEPAAKVELSAENATAGKGCLRITFDGGRWPAVTTAQIPVADWMPFDTFKADVTVSRTCVVGFRVLQEKSSRKEGWDPEVTRWDKTMFMKPGKNELSGNLHPNDWSAIKPDLGKVIALDIYMYCPHKGESIFVDSIRLTSAKDAPSAEKVRISVLGTNATVLGANNVAELLKTFPVGDWAPPQDKTVDQVEAGFKAQFEELKKKHPKAVMAIFRDGEKGYDPANPDKVYAGWKDAHINSHGPDGNVGRAESGSRYETLEVFMRHRSLLMQVDISSIPKGSKILAARFLLVRAAGDPINGRNMWVAEPCNRPWEEHEVNAYEYAKDRFWKEIGGMYYGDDPDFFPVYVAWGEAQGTASTWDFTGALNFWLDGTHENHGFFFHGAEYYWRAFTHEARDTKNRPALFVIYEPPK